MIKDILKITRKEQVCPRERAGNCCVQGNRRSQALMRACVVSPGGCFWTSACPSLVFPLFVPLAFMRFLLILSLIQHLSILWFSLNFIFCLFFVYLPFPLFLPPISLFVFLFPFLESHPFVPYHLPTYIYIYTCTHSVYMFLYTQQKHCPVAQFLFRIQWALLVQSWQPLARCIRRVANHPRL